MARDMKPFVSLIAQNTTKFDRIRLFGHEKDLLRTPKPIESTFEAEDKELYFWMKYPVFLKPIELFPSIEMDLFEE